MKKLPMNGDVHRDDPSDDARTTGAEPPLADLFAPEQASEPQAKESGSPDEEAEVRKRVAEILDELRPYINADGGDIELCEVRDGVVRVRLHGACAGCAMATQTLHLGIERRLKEELPAVKYVEAV